MPHTTPYPTLMLPLLLPHLLLLLLLLLLLHLHLRLPLPRLLTTHTCPTLRATTTTWLPPSTCTLPHLQLPLCSRPPPTCSPPLPPLLLRRLFRRPWTQLARSTMLRTILVSTALATTTPTP